MPRAAGGAGAGKLPFTDAFRDGLVHCNTQVQAYGACLKSMLPTVEKGRCETEFLALKRCFFVSVKRSRGGK